MNSSKSPSDGVRVPIDQLSPEALRSVTEEFVTRDGTEATEASSKVEQVLRQLRSGQAQLWFDADTGTCNILPAG